MEKLLNLPMLTVQRQYSLPNCVLILEGLNTELTDGAASRPPLSVLTKFECHFANESQILQGGRDLLNALATLVHEQAQFLLSGIHPIPKKGQSGEAIAVKLTPETTGKFKLAVDPSILSPAEGKTERDSSADDSTEPVEIELSTVQLFDLVEAFDQLMADNQTLPDLQLALTPLSRREAQASESTWQRYAPFSLGMASLVAAGAIFFALPAPTIRKPEPKPEATPPATQTQPENPQDPANPLPTPTTTSPAPQPSTNNSPSNPPSNPQVLPTQVVPTQESTPAVPTPATTPDATPATTPAASPPTTQPPS
jgi:hypothetical protein